MTLYKEPSENIVGKGENDGNQHFFPFPTMFFILQGKFYFLITFVLLSANPFNLDKPKILSFGKELIIGKLKLLNFT